MVECVVVRPCFDDASSFSFEWCEEVIGWLKEKNVSLVDLAKENATRGKVEATVQNENPKLIIFYNHGTDKGLVEQDGKGYVIDKENDHLLAGREIYTLACEWGADGGVDAWKKGAVAVWCYVEVFTFSTEALDEFQAFANAGIKYKLEGHSWEECLRLAKELADRLCQRLVDAGKYIASILLKQDAEALRCYTQNSPPEESKCIFRNVALKLFGYKVGWKISRHHALAFLTFWCGWGLAIHDFFAECSNPLRFPPHGFFYGIALITLSFFLATYDYVKWLRQ